jgi:hypothetical protein
VKPIDSLLNIGSKRVKADVPTSDLEQEVIKGKQRAVDNARCLSI